MPDTDSDVTAAADLGRQAAEVRPFTIDPEGDALVVALHRDDEHLTALDLEKYLPAPLQPRGNVDIQVVQDFCRYLHRIADRDTATVWADLDRHRIVAVLDDHRGPGTPGWRRHTVTLALQPDEDWRHWVGLDGQRVGQADFAEHVEDGAHCITDPEPATMMEVARTLNAKTDVTFKSTVDLTNSDVGLTYEEETKATAGGNGKLEIPRQFTLRLSPWAHSPAVDMTARLRWRIDRGALKIGYSLLRPDRIIRNAFSGLVAEVTEGLPEGIPPVHIGQAPQIGAGR